MTELVRPWRGVSAEERRTRRRAMLLEACLDVVGADGVTGVTIERVCAAAGLTKRYFYESFTDLDALLGAAADDLSARLRDRMVAAIAGTTDGRVRSHVVVTVLIDVLAEDPRRARLYAESPGQPALRRRRQQAISDFSEFVLASVLPDRMEPLPHAERLLATRLLVAGTTDLVTSWLAGDIEADRATIIATIERVGTST